jgi:MFS family permease
MATTRHDPFAAIRQPNFALFAGGRFVAGAAQTLLQAAIAWQVFKLSDSALQLGVLGLVRFVPQLGMTLVAGAVADRYDRRMIVFFSQLVPLGCSLTLLLATRADVVGLPLIYGLVLLIALSNAFENPARQALLPSVVSKEAFQNAITVNSTIQSLAFVTGPALAGLAIAVASVSGAYTIHVGLLGLSVVSLLLLRPRPVDVPGRAVSVAAIKEGLSFVWHRQALLGCMTLDMFAVIFGGASALLPIYATNILKVGPRGYGLLTASLEIGALAMSIALVALPQVQRTGRALIFAVAAFGLGTIAFGLSRSFALSLAAYMFVGMADQVSVVMRNTTVQLATPDELRGRVTSVNMLFIGASNQLGAVESGFVAALTTATFAVVSGGIGCLAVLAAVAARMPELRSYRVDGGHLDPVEPLAAEDPVMLAGGAG